MAKEKREMGRISGNDLLQMELNLLNAESELTDCESSRKSCMFQLLPDPAEKSQRVRLRI